MQQYSLFLYDRAFFVINHELIIAVYALLAANYSDNVEGTLYPVGR